MMPTLSGDPLPTAHTAGVQPPPPTSRKRKSSATNDGPKGRKSKKSHVGGILNNSLPAEGIHTLSARPKPRPIKGGSALAAPSADIEMPTLVLTPTAPSPSPVDTTTPSPGWFSSASEMLRSESLGQTWDEAVSLWEAFETSTGFPDSRRLPKLLARQRPSCVGDWIRRARNSSYRPTIPDPHDADKNFRSWWTNLQPTWRVSTDGSLIRGRGSWEELRRPGINGLLSVLAALFFWGVACGGKDVQWEAALADVIWVFGEIVAEEV